MADKLLTKELLTSSNYICLNKSVVRCLGVETAFLLSIFSDAETMCSDSNGWFYQTGNMIEELTGLSKYKQAECIKKMVSNGIIEQKNCGTPMKRHFRINYESVQKLVFKKFENYYLKNSKTSIQNSLNNKESNKSITNKEYKLDIPQKANPIDYQLFVDSFNMICKSLPKVVKISDKRRKSIKAMLNNFDNDEIEKIFKMVESSDFLSGKSGQWKASFDWVMNTNNATKVLEGNYKNKNGNNASCGNNNESMSSFIDLVEEE